MHWVWARSGHPDSTASDEGAAAAPLRRCAAALLRSTGVTALFSGDVCMTWQLS
jgi:hypothetical protein